MESAYEKGVKIDQQKAREEQAEGLNFPVKKPDPKTQLGPRVQQEPAFDVLTPRLADPNNLEGAAPCLGADCTKTQLLISPVPTELQKMTPGKYALTNHIAKILATDGDLRALCPGKPNPEICAAKNPSPSCYTPSEDQLQGCKTRCQNEYSSDKKQVEDCQNECPNTCNTLVWASKFPIVNKDCRDGFFVRDGKLGRYAKLAVQSISKNMEHTDSGYNYEIKASDDPTLAAICPRYNQMNVDQKALFHAYRMENLAFPESRCKLKAENFNSNVPNPPACGLYQLECSSRVRCPRRGGACCINPENKSVVTDADLETDELNTACAVSIKDDLIRRPSKKGQPGVKHVIFGEPPSYGSYWQAEEPLPRNSRTSVNSSFRQNLCWFPACHDPGKIEADCNPSTLRKKGIVSGR